jgi:hypothetical protein
MERLDHTRISAEENETTLNFSHANKTFSIYTTASKVARMLEKQFPAQYKLSEDGASATANEVPVLEVTKLWLSKLK